MLRGDPCLCAHSSHLSCGCWGKTQPHTKGALLGTAAAFLFFPHPLCSHFRLQPPDDIPLKERRSHAASPSDAGLFLFSLIPTARLFSERQPPAGGGGAAERSGAGVMLAGGGRLSLPPGRTAHRPSRCWESPGVHRDEGARCGGGVKSPRQLQNPKENTKIGGQRRSRTPTPPFGGFMPWEHSERNLRLLRGQQHQCDKQERTQHPTWGCSTSMGTTSTAFITSQIRIPSTFHHGAVPNPRAHLSPSPPRKGAKGPKFGSVRRAALGWAQGWSRLLLHALNTDSRRVKHLRAEGGLAVLSTQQRVGAVRQRSSFTA